MPNQDRPEQDEPLQIRLMREMVDLSARRSQMAAQRNEMSEQRTYMNMERTLSVWLRTALAAMVMGIVVDRFGIFVIEQPGQASTSDTASLWIGAGLVAFGVIMAVVTTVRFRLYVRAYRRDHVVPHHHGPFVASTFALLAALFGTALLVVLFIGPR